MTVATLFCYNQPPPPRITVKSLTVQLADVQNQVETSASWSSIQYDLLEVKHMEK